MNIMYRPGKSHFIQGIQCEAKHFRAWQVEGALTEGWVHSPGDVQLIGDELTERDPLDTMSNDDIRKLAKDRGLDGWDKRRVNRLRDELRGDDKED